MSTAPSWEDLAITPRGTLHADPGHTAEGPRSQRLPRRARWGRQPLRSGPHPLPARRPRPRTPDKGRMGRRPFEVPSKPNRSPLSRPSERVGFGRRRGQPAAKLVLPGQGGLLMPFPLKDTGVPQGSFLACSKAWLCSSGSGLDPI